MESFGIIKICEAYDVKCFVFFEGGCELFCIKEYYKLCELRNYVLCLKFKPFPNR